MKPDNKFFKSLLKEISSHAHKGRLFSEAANDPLNDDEDNTDPLAGGEDPLAGGDASDPLGGLGGGGGGGDPLGGLGGGDSMGGDPLGGGAPDGADAAGDPESEKDEAEAEKSKAEAESETAKADAEKAKAETEKSKAEKEKAEAEKSKFNGFELFSRPGVTFLVGELLNQYSKENKIDQLAQLFISKLKMDDEGFLKFKSQTGPLMKLKGFKEMVDSMQNNIGTSTTDGEVDDAAENN